MRAGSKIGKNFLLAKISGYTDQCSTCINALKTSSEAGPTHFSLYEEMSVMKAVSIVLKSISGVSVLISGSRCFSLSDDMSVWQADLDFP